MDLHGIMPDGLPAAKLKDTNAKFHNHCLAQYSFVRVNLFHGPHVMKLPIGVRVKIIPYVAAMR